jgi:3-hydroxyisobutyrate dehydrogenase-like beta-hydroxyacid dehydrogenase
MSDAPSIGFVGLGAMGGRMAGLLLEDGAGLTVFDERPEAMAPLIDGGAVALASPAAVADVCETVLVSLPTPEVVREVACGQEGVVRGRAVRTFVDLSTTGAAVSEEIAAVLRDANVVHIDAPVSGGVSGLETRSLAVMASGERESFERVRPLLETFGANVFWVGPSAGQGQLAKLLNNLLSATAMAVTSEALMLGLNSGLDPSLLLEIFNAGSGRNTATSDKFPRQVLNRAFASGFRLQLMAKDVELCLAEARRRHVPMLVGGVVQQLWTLAALQAGEDADHTQLVELYEGWTGTTVSAGSMTAETHG